MSQGAVLRKLLQEGHFLQMPAVYDPLTARLAASVGFRTAYVGGYTSGASTAITEPLMTLTEQVDIAAAIAQATDVPVVADAGAGFGEPLHTTRTVREFCRAGVAGIHIEDQLYPKRAHYHRYVVHGIPVEEFEDKIRYAVLERDRVDPDFVIIARTDTCRALGLEEASMRLNRAANAGADLGLLFPRDEAEAREAPKVCKLPLVYVQSRGNRDGRPLFTRDQLIEMGYIGAIEAQLLLCTTFALAKQVLTELRDTGDFGSHDEAQFIKTRKEIEDLVGLDEHYEIESSTVERRGN